MALITFQDTLACLDVEAIGGDLYTGPNIPMEYYRVFGGQLLAQVIAVASRTAEGKTVKSLHATFPREGDLDKRVEYRVVSLHDGRSFAARQIVAEQAGRIICCALVSLHVSEPGLSHQIPAPDVGQPEEAPAVALSMIPWETRVVGGVDLASRDVGAPTLEVWMRAPGLPDTAMEHQALLAHATDLTLIGTALRPHAGLGEADSPDAIHTAVTTHTVWFHRPFRLDDWVLLAQQSPVTSGARGFGQGHVFTAAGELVASFAQESMIRSVG